MSFSIEVEAIFGPVANTFAMRPSSVSETAVRYENEKTFLVVNYDQARSYELTVRIGKLRGPHSETSFSLAEILRLKKNAEGSYVEGLMLGDKNDLREALSRLAKFTIENARDFLDGNDLSFAQIARFRLSESEKYELDSALRQARAEAEAAWQKKNYQKLVDVLTPLEQQLNDSEKMKLDYSRKHLKES